MSFLIFACFDMQECSYLSVYLDSKGYREVDDADDLKPGTYEVLVVPEKILKESAIDLYSIVGIETRPGDSEIIENDLKCKPSSSNLINVALILSRHKN